MTTQTISQLEKLNLTTEFFSEEQLGLIERAIACYHVKPFIYDRWGYEKPLTEISSISCENLNPVDKDVFGSGDQWVICSDHLGGSDYSGGLVNKSNKEAFWEKFGEIDGVYSVYGGMGSYDVAIALHAIAEGMCEVFDGLCDYPLIDDDRHSQLEHDKQNEAWESWASSEFENKLAKHIKKLLFNEINEDSPEWKAYAASYLEKHSEEIDLEGLLDDLEVDSIDLVLDDGTVTRDSLQSLFCYVANKASEYWQNSEGDSMWIDVDKVVKAIALDDVLCNSPTNEIVSENSETWELEITLDGIDIREYGWIPARFKRVDPNQLSLPV